jgi:subtilisin family serine protease
MLASRARTSLPLTLASVALGATLIARTATAPPHGPAQAKHLAEIHVKMKAEGMPLAIAATIGMRIEPMFDDAARASHDDRARWLVVTAATAGADADVADEIAADPAVEEAFVAPHIDLPTAGDPFETVDPQLIEQGLIGPPLDGESCPITTPSFETYQGYLMPAPQGIDASAAWQRGHRGAGVWFADIEGGWNAAHEDLPGARIEHAGGIPIDDRSWRAHGTAVLGEVVGVDNGKGVERVFTSSIGGTTVGGAIDAAAARLRAGDVLLIELQGQGPRGRYLPVEYWDDAYDAIRAATARGVIIIEAAGNGGENLDHKAYKGKFDRSQRDSGAIMVGAGGPARDGWHDRERLDFSNYGSRVDVQGWGRKVATLDYGDLQRCDDTSASRHYTDEFSGTSSASPIVAGAAVILEGVARARGRVPLSPTTLRALLRETGTPQAGDTERHIGPRPDLARALASLGE